MPKTFETSADVVLLTQRLRAAPIGATITYGDMSAIIGRDIQKSGRSALASARRICQRDDGAVFGTVANVGIQRLSDVEIVHTGDGDMARIGRTARRGVRRLASVRDFSALPNAEKVKHNQTISMLGAIGHFSKPSKVAAIAVQQPNPVGLPLGTTLKQFSKIEGVQDA